MSFDVVNVNDEVLRDGEQRIDREGKHQPIHRGQSRR